MTWEGNKKDKWTSTDRRNHKTISYISVEVITSSVNHFIKKRLITGFVLTFPLSKCLFCALTTLCI